MKAWVVAARPATLLAAVSPVLLGSALARDDGEFHWGAGLAALAGAVLIQIGVNFANDAADAARGADTPDRIGPPRAVASGLLSPRAVWAGTAVVFGLAAGCGIYLAVISGWPILVIGAAALLAALGYTSGPAYGYHGLGEIAVFVFFGLAATVGTRYVHDSTAPADAWVMALPAGFLITAILVVNNVRDMDTDRRTGKHTLAVKMGRRGSAWFFVALLGAAFGVTGVAAALGALPPLAAVGLIATPLAIGPVRTLFTTAAGPPLIKALESTAQMQFVFAGAAALAIALGAAA